jgi:hypothetical protein
MATHRKVPARARLDVSAVLATSSQLVATCRATHAEAAVILARSKMLARRRGGVTPG